MSTKHKRFLKSRKGSLLLETMVAMAIMLTVGAAFITMIQKTIILSAKTREKMTCTRMAQTVFVRVKNIDFYYLFDADSGQPNHGLQAGYPYRAVLDGIQETLGSSKFNKFSIKTQFLRRDSSDVNGNGLTSDLIPFTDANADDIDDYDSAIRYNDQNGDGDCYDTYLSGGRTVAEQPDTHIKQVTVNIYRRDRLICSQTDLISLEQFSGEPNPSSESVLRLLISTPVNSSFLYSLATSQQQDSRALAISKSYPQEIYQYRADAISPLEIAGETDPLADVKFYVGASAELDSIQADFDGFFSFQPFAVTSALVEGANILRGQSVKDVYTSPVTQRRLLLDTNPPGIASETPSGTVGTRSPCVSAILMDSDVSTTTTSGICQDVTSMKVNGQDVYFTYDHSSGEVVWIDSATMTVPTLFDGDYTVVVEGGDYAGYKAASTWTFTVSWQDTDNSAPSIAQKAPSGMAGSALPEISAKVFDNQSGIIPSSILLKLDDLTVVDSSNIGAHYDPVAGKVTYVPEAAFEPGSFHTVELTASHWATDPPEKITSTDTWSFTVP